MDSEFYQGELSAVMQRLVDTQAKAIEAQNLAIERGAQLLEALQELEILKAALKRLSSN